MCPQTGIAWFAAVSNSLMSRLPPPLPGASLSNGTRVCSPGTVDGLVGLVQDWRGPFQDLLQASDSYRGAGSGEGDEALVMTEAMESALGYQGTPAAVTATAITTTTTTTTQLLLPLHHNYYYYYYYC
jgi:hypothetical protein